MPRLESLEDRLAPAFFSLHPGDNLLATIQTADGNADATNTIILAPGNYPVTGGLIQNTVTLGIAPNILTKSLEIPRPVARQLVGGDHPE